MSGGWIMTNRGQINSEELKIQGLLDRFLQFRKISSNHNGHENHLDEDSLTAFVEGRVNEREMPFMIKHLVDCSFCLHITSELAKLSTVFTEDEFVITTPTKEPTKVADVLSGLLSRIFGANDGTVFAHQEQEKEEKEEPKEEKEKLS